MAKNLFLRDAKGRNHFLLTVAQDKKTDLKALQERLACSRLSFASARRLEQYLKLIPGSVSPFGVINNAEKNVRVIIDADLIDMPIVGVHPNDNSATIWLTGESLLAFLRAWVKDVIVMEF